MTPGNSLFLVRVLSDPGKARLLLEEEVIGPSWRETVAELATLYGPGDEGALPAELSSRILSHGFVGLNEAEFRTLLTSPRRLLPLQKAILLDGGPHWDAVVERTRSAAAPSPALRPHRTWLPRAATLAATVLVAFLCGWWCATWTRPVPPESIQVTPSDLPEGTNGPEEPYPLPPGLPDDPPIDLPV